jgi:hypothetical protein
MGRGRPSKKTTTFVPTGRPKSQKITICVVYRKPNSKKMLSKHVSKLRDRFYIIYS